MTVHRFGVDPSEIMTLRETQESATRVYEMRTEAYG